jgi:tetraacyldisaccharide 4'-kinase
VLKKLTLIASGAYKAATAVRNWSYDQGLTKSCRSVLPIVSVGNLTVGGNGKTPLCLFVAAELLKRGYKTTILSRGYGGSAHGPHHVKPDDDAVVVGDEPLLMAKSGVAEVIISRDRVKGAQFIVNNKLGDVVILDDGFQHRRLKRDVDIVTVDIGSSTAVEEFIAGQALPAGPFREERGAGLKRADIIIFTTRQVLKNETAPIDARILRLIPNKAQLYRAHLKAHGVFELGAHGTALKPCQAVAFCAIAKPEGFFRSLEEMGFDLVHKHAFRDHHRFSSADINRIFESGGGLPMICTAKDAVKLQNMKIPAIPYVLNVSMQVTPADAFLVRICRAIELKQPR